MFYVWSSPMEQCIELVHYIKNITTNPKAHKMSFRIHPEQGMNNAIRAGEISGAFSTRWISVVTPEEKIADAVIKKGMENATVIVDAAVEHGAETAARVLKSDEAAQSAYAVAGCICAGCCCVVFATLYIVAYIVGFVGLAHTQRVNLDPMCPAGYWKQSLDIIVSRFLLFLVAAVISIVVKCVCSKNTGLVICTSVCGLCLTFSLTVANTAVTAQAWNAFNCTDAVRASRDADPLLMTSGSLFMMLDWTLMLLGCCGACVWCCEHGQKIRNNLEKSTTPVVEVRN